jgi:Domain of unknown function (DUF4406)
MEISEITKKYWTPQDLVDLEKCEDPSSMHAIARRIIDRMPRPIVEVCGPIGSGGLGNLEANLTLFNKTIQELQANGLHVFDQMPFEYPMQALKKKLADPMQILNEFYLPLFESKEIATFYFIPGWESSVGSNWEHDLGKKLGIEIIYL